jgi:hypothetical protein
VTSTGQHHPAVEAKALPNQVQADDSNVPSPDNSDPTRKTDRSSPGKPKEDAA